MARDLVGCDVVLGLSGLLVDESESWESCTVTQLITLVLWLVAELKENKTGVFFSKIKAFWVLLRSGEELTRQRGTSGRSRPPSRCGW